MLALLLHSHLSAHLSAHLSFHPLIPPSIPHLLLYSSPRHPSTHRPLAHPSSAQYHPHTLGSSGQVLTLCCDIQTHHPERMRRKARASCHLVLEQEVAGPAWGNLESPPGGGDILRRALRMSRSSLTLSGSGAGPLQSGPGVRKCVVFSGSWRIGSESEAGKEGS